MILQVSNVLVEIDQLCELIFDELILISLRVTLFFSELITRR